MSKMSKRRGLRKTSTKRRLSKRNSKKSRKSRRMKGGTWSIGSFFGKKPNENTNYDISRESNSGFGPNSPGSIPVMGEKEYKEYRDNYSANPNPTPVDNITIPKKSWF